MPTGLGVYDRPETVVLFPKISRGMEIGVEPYRPRLHQIVECKRN